MNKSIAEPPRRAVEFLPLLFLSGCLVVLSLAACSSVDLGCLERCGVTEMMAPLDVGMAPADLAPSDGSVAPLDRFVSDLNLSVTSIAYPTENAPIGLVTANPDAKLGIDLIFSTSADYPLAILTNNGDGTYRGPTTIQLVPKNPGPLASGDFNGDGKIDLVTCDSLTTTVSLLLGDGTGKFTVQSQVTLSLAAGAQLSAISVADFNGDQHLDVALGTGAEGSVILLMGNGDGTLAPFAARNKYASGGGTQWIVVADFNGDGSTDVAAVNSMAMTIQIFINTSDGSGTLRTGTQIPTGASPWAAAAGDFNLDGFPDLVVATPDNGEITVWLSMNKGSLFVASSDSPHATGSLPYVPAVGDFNGDGFLDAAVSNGGSNWVSLMVGDGLGGLGLASHVGVGVAPRDLVSGDLDGDGKMDLAVANSGDATISVILAR